MNVLDFKKMKSQNQKITMVTCYDYTSAKIIEQSQVDCILVGDSVAMVVYGHPNTTLATVEMISNHTQAVARGLDKKFLVADLPFLSYRKSLADTMNNVKILIQAGANAVKLEGGIGNSETIRHIVDSGVPVMGHIGLTPQAIHQLGGHKVQGKNQDRADDLMQQALTLQEAGCFAMVLECMPAELASAISQKLSIPTIGIGAGPGTDGQILVLPDLLGLQNEFKPKFLKHYLNGFEVIKNAVDNYSFEVKNTTYPMIEEHCY